MFDLKGHKSGAESPMELNTLPGKSYPLGATVHAEGVNFCIFSKDADYLELLFFDNADDEEPSSVIKLDKRVNRTFYYWHVFVLDIRPGQLYAYRAFGPYNREKGFLFEPDKILVDPYAKAIIQPQAFSRKAAIMPGNNCAQALKSAVIPEGEYDWEGDEPLNIPYSTSVIYEMHVKGFTMHPSSGVTDEKKGTFAGLIEKIPYLQQLGITAVELLPVHQFDEQDARGGLTNYWGYTPINFFAPHFSYAYSRDPVGLVHEFKDMVKALHRAGIEVILDVVFNHTAEGGEDGPNYCYKGLANRAYYILNHGRSEYMDYTGCGNTLNTNHSIVRRMIMDSLRYWASEMHIDGFRFDLASVLSRDESGVPLKNPPILWEIESDPMLAHCKIIAEAWDAAGLYQVGSFIGDKWAEWNGHYRDDVRKFIKGDKGLVKNLASRILGSPDIYPDPYREPNRSIHFITCHDGFTLLDLVSYNEKHNIANQEKNRDGNNQNDSWNHGHEGASESKDLAKLREQQMKNFFTLLFLSQGTPMVLMGDEVKRTQHGNNNAYCQDNATSWFNWELLYQNQVMFNYVKTIIDFTQRLEVFRLESVLPTKEVISGPHLIWHGTKPLNPDWHDYSRSLAFSLSYPEYKEYIYVIMNAYWQGLAFELPPLSNGMKWHRIVDTSLEFPNDIVKPQKARKILQNIYKANPRSIVVLIGK